MSLRSILASEGLMRIAASEADVLKALKGLNYPLSTEEVWAALQKSHPKKAVSDWLSEGNEQTYDWGDVEVLDEHPLWEKIEKTFQRESGSLEKLLTKMSEAGKLAPRRKTHGGGGQWELPQ